MNKITEKSVKSGKVRVGYCDFLVKIQRKVRIIEKNFQKVESEIKFG